MDAGGEETTQNNVMAENAEKPHNDEEFFEDTQDNSITAAVTADGENEEGHDFRYSPGRGGFRYVFKSHFSLQQSLD